MADQDQVGQRGARRPTAGFPGDPCPFVGHAEVAGRVFDERSSTERFSIREAGDGLSVCDPNGIVVFVNERLCEMLGVVAGEMVGRPADAFLSAAAEEKAGTTAGICPHCGRVHREAVLRRNDGSSLPVAVDRHRLIDSQGRLLGTLDVIMDVSRKTRLEQTLHENADWQCLVVDSLNDVFWVAEVEGVECDGSLGAASPGPGVDIKSLFARWRFTYVSSSFERVFGYALPDPSALNPYDAVPEAVHAEVERQLSLAVEQAMNAPEGASFPEEMVLPFITASGAPCWCETTARVLYDPARKVLRFVGVTRDVTESHQVEETLRASEARFRAICDAAQDAVVMVDADGNTIHWNPAAERMFGYRGEEVIGRDMHALLAPRRLQDKIRRGVEEYGRSGQGPVIGNVIQSTAVHKDGSEFPVEIAVSPLWIEGRRAALGIIRDITDQTMAEEAVRREQRRLAQLLDVYEGHRKMATYEIHDGVTQPLVSALMTFDAFSAVRSRCPDAAWPDFDAAVAMLHEALSETRRFMSGMRPPVLDEFGVVSALDHLICEHRVSGSASIEYCCNVTFERLTPPLETAVFRIVQEGLVNAQRHSQSQRIRIELLEQADRLRILVQDWGIGFNPADVPPDHFGLEGIRERAATVGGQASIESSPGVGTRIHVDLPLLKERPAEA